MIMARIFRKKSSVKLPQRDREAEHEEYGRERKGIAECPLCHNVRFKKKWHVSLQELQEHAKDKVLKVEREERCPACTTIKEHLYEGELFLEEFPDHLRIELLRLVHNFGERATARDPQDRIIDVKETARGYRVTTTENQLANRLAKKIKDVFNTVKIHFSHSEEPYEVDRIHVTFHGV